MTKCVSPCQVAPYMGICVLGKGGALANTPHVGGARQGGPAKTVFIEVRYDVIVTRVVDSVKIVDAVRRSHASCSVMQRGGHGGSPPDVCLKLLHKDRKRENI